ALQSMALRLPPAAVPAVSFPNPAFGLGFADLYSSEGAARLDALFLARLRETDAALADRLAAARAAPDAIARKDESTLLIDVAPHVEDFIARLFGVEHKRGGIW